jgi:hypothetical protein
MLEKVLINVHWEWPYFTLYYFHLIRNLHFISEPQQLPQEIEMHRWQLLCDINTPTTFKIVVSVEEDKNPFQNDPGYKTISSGYCKIEKRWIVYNIVLTLFIKWGLKYEIAEKMR